MTSPRYLQTMTLERNSYNGVQAGTTESQPVTAWRNSGCGASYNSFVVGSGTVLRRLVKSVAIENKVTAASQLPSTTVRYTGFNQIYLLSQSSTNDSTILKNTALNSTYRRSG